MAPMITASVPEMAAAEALLELCNDARRAPAHAPKRTQPPQTRTPPSQESSALSSFVPRGATSTPKSIAASRPPTIINLASGGYIVRRNTSPDPFKDLALSNRYHPSLHKKHQEEQRQWIKNRPAKLDDTMTERKDAATQTEIDDSLSQIQEMESKMKELSNKIQTLEHQLDNAGKDSKSDISHIITRTRCKTRTETSSSNNSYKISSENEDTSDDKDLTIKEENDMSVSDEASSDEEHNVMVRTSNGATNDMVPIGDGNAYVPKRLLRQLDWSSYTNATRKLLTAVFSRRVLATHSLTGKPSPAFPDKPAKKRLDAALVNDIVQTVVDRCKVPENVVRTSITTKCADESKMLRTRQLNRKKSSFAKKENVPPRTLGMGGSRQP